MKAPHQNVTFEQLITKVKLAEDLLEARERATVSRYRQLKQAWQAGWTPRPRCATDCSGRHGCRQCGPCLPDRQRIGAPAAGGRSGQADPEHFKEIG